MLREGANTDHPSWALVLYTRAAIISSTLMIFSSFWPLLLVCKVGPPLDMGECTLLDVIFYMSSGI